jgi:NTE family protein
MRIPDSQRALVLQGGGSLGAYEAGAYQALYEKITKIDREKGETGKPFSLNKSDPFLISLLEHQ